VPPFQRAAAETVVNFFLVASKKKIIAMKNLQTCLPLFCDILSPFLRNVVRRPSLNLRPATAAESVSGRACRLPRRKDPLHAGRIQTLRESSNSAFRKASFVPDCCRSTSACRLNASSVSQALTAVPLECCSFQTSAHMESSLRNGRPS
jgi:hypothetical protein